MTTGMVPVLGDPDSERQDWTRARYAVDITIKDVQLTVEHRLSDCPEIQELLDNGSAAYATELRCPWTLFSRIERSDRPSQLIQLDDAVIEDSLFMLSGVLATRPARMEPGGLKALVSAGRSSIEVPQGWWLAKAQPRSHTPLLGHLLKFRKDENLPEGAMSVVEVADGDAPMFRAWLAADLWTRLQSGRQARDVQVAALIGAFGRLPNSALARNGAFADHPLTVRLRELLEVQEGMTTWDDPDGFDPARAATAIERFDRPPKEDPDE